MLTKDIRQTIVCLKQEGLGTREISRLLKLSRNSIRKVLAIGVDVPPIQKEIPWVDLLPIVRELFIRCKGNAVRIREILKEEYDTDIAYSTLTRLVQSHTLRGPVVRVGEISLNQDLRCSMTPLHTK